MHSGLAACHQVAAVLLRDEILDALRHSLPPGCLSPFFGLLAGLSVSFFFLVEDFFVEKGSTRVLPSSPLFSPSVLLSAHKGSPCLNFGNGKLCENASLHHAAWRLHVLEEQRGFSLGS